MTNTPADDGQTADGPGSDQRSIVIDAVLHPYNFLPENARNEIAEGFCKGTYATLGLTGDKAFVTEQEYRRNWSIGELADIVFTESDVDLGVYHAVPWFDYFDDGLVSNEKGIEMHGRWPDRVMFYGTGGAAFANVQAAAGAFPFSSSTQAGWVAGAGIEYAFMPNWTAKVEYLFVDLGNQPCSPVNCSGTATNVSLNESIIRGGINYKFW